MRRRIGPRQRQRVGRTGERIGGGSLRGPAFGVFVDRKQEHRIGAHEKRIALREIVAHDRRAAREERVSRLLPVFAVIAEGEHLVLRIVDLNVAP